MSRQERRKRTTCHDCGTPTQLSPTELQLSPALPGRRRWLWAAIWLCPPCLVAFRDHYLPAAPVQELELELVMPGRWHTTSHRYHRWELSPWNRR